MLHAQAKQKGAEWLAEAALHGVMAAIMLPYTAWKVVGLVSSQWGLVLNRCALRAAQSTQCRTEHAVQECC